MMITNNYKIRGKLYQTNGSETVLFTHKNLNYNKVITVC